MKDAVLPCNGLDKPFGQRAREAAMELSRLSGAEIICPVLLNNSPDRYRSALDGISLTVIDGCATHCASRLAARLDLKIGRKVLIADAVKRATIQPEDELAPGPAATAFTQSLAAALNAEAPTAESDQGNVPAAEFPAPADFIRVTHDKYVFKIPVSGFWFNENDSWVQVIGRFARVGVSDFAQQRLTDIAFFDPPEVGKTVDQFGEVGVIESAKAVLEIVSPVAGRIVAVNNDLVKKPELINEDPYGRGWIAEIELTDFNGDQDLLIGPDAYAEIVRKKAADA